MSSKEAAPFFVLVGAVFAVIGSVCMGVGYRDDFLDVYYTGFVFSLFSCFSWGFAFFPLGAFCNIFISLLCLGYGAQDDSSNLTTAGYTFMAAYYFISLLKYAGITLDDDNDVPKQVCASFQLCASAIAGSFLLGYGYTQGEISLIISGHIYFAPWYFVGLCAVSLFYISIFDKNAEIGLPVIIQSIVSIVIGSVCTGLGHTNEDSVLLTVGIIFFGVFVFTCFTIGISYVMKCRQDKDKNGTCFLVLSAIGASALISTTCLGFGSRDDSQILVNAGYVFLGSWYLSCFLWSFVVREETLIPCLPCSFVCGSFLLGYGYSGNELDLIIAGHLYFGPLYGLLGGLVTLGVFTRITEIRDNFMDKPFLVANVVQVVFSIISVFCIGFGTQTESPATVIAGYVFFGMYFCSILTCLVCYHELPTENDKIFVWAYPLLLSAIVGSTFLSIGYTNDQMDLIIAGHLYFAPMYLAGEVGIAFLFCIILNTLSNGDAKDTTIKMITSLVFGTIGAVCTGVGYSGNNLNALLAGTIFLGAMICELWLISIVKFRNNEDIEDESARFLLVSLLCCVIISTIFLVFGTRDDALFLTVSGYIFVGMFYLGVLLYYANLPDGMKYDLGTLRGAVKCSNGHDMSRLNYSYSSETTKKPACDVCGGTIGKEIKTYHRCEKCQYTVCSSCSVKSRYKRVIIPVVIGCSIIYAGCLLYFGYTNDAIHLIASGYAHLGSICLVILCGLPIVVRRLPAMMMKFRDNFKNKVDEMDTSQPIDPYVHGAAKVIGTQFQWVSVAHVILSVLDMGSDILFVTELFQREDETKGEENHYNTHFLIIAGSFVVFPFIMNLLLIYFCGKPPKMQLRSPEETLDETEGIKIFGAEGAYRDRIHGVYHRTKAIQNDGYVYKKKYEATFIDQFFCQTQDNDILIVIDKSADDPEGTGRWTILPKSSCKSGYGWATISVNLFNNTPESFYIESEHPYSIENMRLQKRIEVPGAVGYKLQILKESNWSSKSLMEYCIEDSRHKLLPKQRGTTIAIDGPSFDFVFDAGSDREIDEIYWGFKIAITPILSSQPRDIISTIKLTNVNSEKETFWQIHDGENWTHQPNLKVKPLDNESSGSFFENQVSSMGSEIASIIDRAKKLLDCWYLNHRMGTRHELHGTWHRPCQVLQSMFFFLYPLHLLVNYLFIVVMFAVWCLNKALNVFYCVLGIVLQKLASFILFMIALSNSELCYLFYGDPEFFTLMTSAGVYIEDIPQFIIQVCYSIVMSVKFKQSVSVFQWISFALTFWHFGFSASYKYVTFGEPPPPPFQEYFMNTADAVETVGDPDHWVFARGAMKFVSIVAKETV